MYVVTVFIISYIISLMGLFDVAAHIFPLVFIF